jgi:60 kDa SS-A/Ro ribonucleoprotein
MHYTGFGSRSTTTPQTEAIPGREAEMKPNNAGGVSFAVDDMTRLQRFLVLGSAAGTFYVGKRKLTKENLDTVERLLKAGQGKEVIDKIVEISDAGRAVSNDPALFALARCCACDVFPDARYIGKDGKEHARVHPDNILIRRYAYAMLPRIARTGTHLLHFMEYTKQFRGDGPAHLRAVRRWYDDKPVEKLAYQLLKYQQRDGWSQRDVLRTSHPKASAEDRNTLYHWAARGWPDVGDDEHPEPSLRQIWAYEKAKRTTDDREIATLIKKYRLPREAVPTEHLKSLHVWEALIEDMPLEAMMRNLATMTKLGVLEPMGSFTASVATRLRNTDAIRRARLHPIKILAALTTYQSGQGVRSSATWKPIARIVDALNDAFYASFEAVEPTNKRLLIAIDVSGSMHGTFVNGIPRLECHTAAAAMAMVTAKAEWTTNASGLAVPNYHIMAYDTRPHPLSISPNQRLDDVVRTVEGAGGGGTNCAVPILWALQNNVNVDVFVSFTDSESWQGPHVSQAIKQYRARINPTARIVNVQMAATDVSNNDPRDLLAMEVVGFDTSVPAMLSEFVSGNI